MVIFTHRISTRQLLIISHFLIHIKTYAYCIFLITFYYNLSASYAQPASLGLPFSYHIEPAQYGAGMQNPDMEQDSRGFMYFANNFGLLEFDGANWQTYRVKDGSKVRSIAIAENGKIYTAAQGEFGYFEPNKEASLSYRSLSKDLPDEHSNVTEVWKVFIGSNEVYFCTFSKIFVYYQDNLVDVLNIPEALDFFFINNQLYIQTLERGLQVLFNGTLNNVTNLNLNTNELVIAIVKDSENSLLFVTNFGRGISNSGGLQFDLELNSSTDFSLLASSAIRLYNGQLALGTNQGGLYLLAENGKITTHLTKNKGLESRTIVNMLEDIDGNLWISHNNGISVVELGVPFSYINEDMGLPGSGYDAFADSKSIYLATNYGLYKSSFDLLNFELVENTTGQSYSVAEIHSHILLGHHNGSFVVHGGRAKPISTATGMWKVMNDPLMQNKIIAGTYEGLDLYEESNGDINYIKRIPGLNESSRVMEFDDSGKLWMTHGYKGVFRITLSPELDSIVKLDYFGIEDGLPSNELINVYKLNNKLLFTTINGIYKFDPTISSFYKDTLNFNDPEFNQALNYLATDGNNKIYYLANNSMGVLSQFPDGSTEVEHNIFNKVFTKLNDDLVNISVINSSNILYGAKEGFVIYNPMHIRHKSRDHQTYVRQVRLSNNDSIIYNGNLIQTNTESVNDTSENIILDYALNSLNFVFSSNFLNDYKETEYSYFLEGFDESWSPWTKSTEINYTNLFESDYIFHVKARNIYNEEAIKTTYRFTIMPPWYRSPKAYAAYAITILGGLIFSFVLIDSKYRKSKRQYEQEKQQEVDEIGSKLETLTQTTSEEINKLKTEKLEVEVDKKNTELAASTMNLINKNKFISHIKNDLSSISKKSKSDEVKKELSSIMKEIDKNISHDDDWKQFTFHFNNVHGDFTTRLTQQFQNLSGQDIRLCSYLRLNLSTKEIADLLNISVRGVEISRYRLRKKLNLSRSQNLAEFILNF